VNTHALPSIGGSPLRWVAAVLGLAAPAALVLGAPVPVRLVLVLAFVLVVPGSAVLAWFPQRDTVVTAALVVVFGIAMVAGVSAVMLWADFWRPALGLVLLGTASVVSLVVAQERQSRKAVTR
jgi:hypothetical protein